MPNWVRNCISVEEKYSEKLEEISKVGLARFYFPLPEDLKETTAPAKIGDNISEEKSESLINKYEFNNWYEWAISNWGTKWGCCDNEFKDNEYWFNTAWCPLSSHVFEKLLKDIPNFKFIWEEEQGFGQKWECKDGVFIMIEEWEMPDWDQLLNTES